MVARSCFTRLRLRQLSDKIANVCGRFRSALRVLPWLLILVVAGCFHPAWQTSADVALLRKLSFKAPHGWIGPLPAPLGAELWTSRDRKHAIELFNVPNATHVDVSLIGRTNTAIRICGSQPAELVHRGRPLSQISSDSIETINQHNEIVASYIYPNGATPDPAAEDSIRMLCLKSNIRSSQK